MHGSVVELVIKNRSAIVFDGILDSRHSDNEDQRYGIDTGIRSSKDGEKLEAEFGIWQNSIGYLLTYHQDNIEKEKDIGNIMELEPYVLRNERQGRVLGGSDFVSRVRLGGIPLLVLPVCRQW